MLGLHLDTLIIGQTFRRMLSILNEFTLQKAQFYVNNVFGTKK